MASLSWRPLAAVLVTRAACCAARRFVSLSIGRKQCASAPRARYRSKIDCAPRTDEDPPATLVVFGLVSDRLEDPNFLAAIDVARPHCANLRGSHAGEPLQPHHVGDDVGEEGQGGVYDLIAHWQHRRRLPGFSPPGSEPGDHGQCLRDARGDQLFASGPLKHPADPTDHLINRAT